jgi:hypothetical protein
MELRPLFRSRGTELKQYQALEDEYANWRKEAEAVTVSYRTWIRAPRTIRRMAYETYLATLDREERAAGAYRRLIDEFDRR